MSPPPPKSPIILQSADLHQSYQQFDQMYQKHLDLLNDILSSLSGVKSQAKSQSSDLRP